MAIITKVRYTDQELIRACIRDQISDIRFCDRLIAAGEYVSENTAYREQCKVELRAMLKMRHGPKFNKYGYPVL